jgi:hypothetical protein
VDVLRVHIKKRGVPGTTMYAQRYVFLEPSRLWIVYPEDLRVELVGYGIGDTIDVMEPEIQDLGCSYEEKDFLELEGGGNAYTYRSTDDWPVVGRV